MIWKEKYKVGVDLIDGQHEELFRRVTDFVETLRSPGEAKEKADRVSSTLSFMQEYVVTHFQAEEAYQKRMGYPDLPQHIKLHREMVRYVTDVAEQYHREGYNEQLMQQFAGRLLAWLINHVVAEDQKIAAYVKAKEMSGNE